MRRKTLIAMAVAALLAGPAAAFAGGANHAAYNDMNAVDTAAAAPIEIGDGVLAWYTGDEFDGPMAAESEGKAVGATSSEGGSGTAGFSSSGGAVSSTSGPHGSAAGALTEEAYLVPAPLAYNNGKRWWKVEVSPSNVKDIERLHTENVYVMMPIEDAIVDPRVALTEGPEGVLSALNDPSNAG